MKSGGIYRLSGGESSADGAGPRCADPVTRARRGRACDTRLAELSTTKGSLGPWLGHRTSAANVVVISVTQVTEIIAFCTRCRMQQGVPGVWRLRADGGETRSCARTFHKSLRMIPGLRPSSVAATVQPLAGSRHQVTRCPSSGPRALSLRSRVRPSAPGWPGRGVRRRAPDPARCA